MVKAICVLTGYLRAFGVVRFELNEGGYLTIKGEFSGLPPGKHGLHVHSFGDITNDWISAGPLYIPTNKMQGMQQDKRHAGDLGIVNTSEDGLAKLDVAVSHFHLTGIHSIIGRTLVLMDQFITFTMDNAHPHHRDGHF
ncbi:superoxide dismutase [Cu-Zn]-like isoform X2 [Pristis pectinata]|uniref:superoxide dismutase [Cu-Zn]-like isoform X2 n=1 Tax=Pristis pectinata TaxID=685728 RepID=UPI00223E8B16|nr:superoxide dismutase [Cu-Zn]-like isoform X2 [Pristis pectinata]